MSPLTTPTLARRPWPAADGDQLTERGREQAAAAAPWTVSTRGHPPDRLARCDGRGETAAAIGSALDLEPTVLDYVDELRDGESFEDLVARVRRLKAELDAQPAGELPLLVTHGIFLRFFLLDSVLGDGFVPAMAARVWNLRSDNCGLSVFEHGEARDPGGSRGSRLDLPQLDGAAVGSAR